MRLDGGRPRNHAYGTMQIRVLRNNGYEIFIMKALRNRNIAKECLDVICKVSRTARKGQHYDQTQCTNGGSKDHEVNGDSPVIILEKS